MNNSKSESRDMRDGVQQNDSVVNLSSVADGSLQQAKASATQTSITSIMASTDLVTEQCGLKTDLQTRQSEESESQQTLNNSSEGWSDIDESLLTNAADAIDTHVSTNENIKETAPTVLRLNSVIPKLGSDDRIYQPTRAGCNIEPSNSEQLMKSPKRAITKSADVMHTPEKQIRRETDATEDVSPMRRSLRSLEF